jgi:hypothetical protein
MTEVAIVNLSSVAELLTGVTILRVARDADGKLSWIRAPSGWWIPPWSDNRSMYSMSEEDRLSTPPVAARMKAWVAFLKPRADSDGSGFVSTREAMLLRSRVELGFVASAFRDAPTIRELAGFLGQPPEQVTKDLIAYTALRDAAMREGMLGFPALPAGLLDGV